MSSSTVESDSKQKSMEQIWSQREDGPAEPHDRLGEAAAFRVKQHPNFLTESASSGRPVHDCPTEKTEEPKHSDNKAADRKLVAEVLVRYWNLKEKQQKGTEQKQLGIGNLPDGDAVASSRGRERGYRRSAKKVLGDRRDRDASTPFQSQEHDHKLPAQKAFASVNSRSPEKEYNPSWQFRFTHAEPNREGLSSHNNPQMSSRRNEATHMLRKSDAVSPASEEQLKAAEKAHPSAPITPIDPDVLFGRRQAQRKHPGNIRLRELCRDFQQEYRNGDRGNKTAITWRIVHMIQQEGGRFLKFNSRGEDWTEVDSDMAREKVAFTIRDTFHQVPTRDA